KVEVPQNARRIDAKGTTVTAGWIDARGSTPLEMAAILDAGQQAPGNRAIDGLDLVDREGRVRDALRRGVTSCYVAPGRGLMAGQGALVKMRPNETDLEKLEVEDAEALEIVGGSSRGSGAVNRLAEWTILRRTLRETQKYRESLDAYHEELEKFLEEKKKGAKTAPRAAGAAEEKSEERTPEGGPTPVPRRRRPPRNQDEADLLAALQVLRVFPIVNDPEGAVLLDADAQGVETIEDPDACGHLHPPGADGPIYFFEDAPQTKPGESKTVERPKKPPMNATWDALLPGLTREVPVRFEARRADEIRAAIAVAKEFRLRGVIEGADEADLVLDEIAESKMPVVITPARSAEWPRDGRERSATLAAALEERGIPYAIGTGRDLNGTRWLRAQVALAIAGGATREEALAAVTSRAAEILGVDDRLGSLEPGHEADLVIFEGDPFDPTTEVRAAIVDGDVLFER
ncbi:MAG TPA: amidohydrolase family protein, partial [Planctomycetota bacterium]|nr:amidohydrolase family protein [Planctomycetota bacterium]